MAATPFYTSSVCHVVLFSPQLLALWQADVITGLMAWLCIWWQRLTLLPPCYSCGLYYYFFYFVYLFLHAFLLPVIWSWVQRGKQACTLDMVWEGTLIKLLLHFRPVPTSPLPPPNICLLLAASG